MLVLGYHHPLEVVKRYGTLDLLSGGRVILGVGVGSLAAEFDLLGAEFADRGARADDALGAIRAAFGQRRPTYHGATYRFDELIVDPAGVQDHVPIWVGGRTPRSLRRALELGDGWIPFGLDAEALAAVLAAPATTARLQARRDQGRPFDLILAPEPPLDPGGRPDATRAVIERYQAMGATGLALRLVSTSRSHHLDQLAALRALVPT